MQSVFTLRSGRSGGFCDDDQQSGDLEPSLYCQKKSPGYCRG